MSPNHTLPAISLRTLVASSAVLFATIALIATALPRSAGAAESVIVLDGATSAEGIATGEGSTFYAGDLNGGSFDPSAADATRSGDIYRGDYATGEVERFIDAPDGRYAVGLSVDTASDLLFVAGGPTGNLFVYSTATGEEVATVEIGEGFINDVIVVGGGAWVTNSQAAVLTFIPVTDGEVGEATTLELSGPAADTSGAFNLNGIEQFDTDTLIVANSNLGGVFTVDTTTGTTAEIVLDQTVDEGGLVGADGLLMDGAVLRIVENQANRVTSYQLSEDASTGTLALISTDPAFTVPTTAASVDEDSIAVVNAQFGVTDDTEFEVVVVSLAEGDAPTQDVRLAGEGRIETAVAVSQFGYPDGAGDVILTRADAFPDALAASGLSNGPVLLVPSCGELPQVVADEITRLSPDRVITLGGPNAVCQDLVDAAIAAAG